MIVKEKGKRKNGKVWTSLLFHFSLFIFHFSLFAEHPSLTSDGDHIGDSFGFPSDMYDVSPAVIPGDRDFYQVLDVEAQLMTWNVYTNGLFATRASEYDIEVLGSDVSPGWPLHSTVDCELEFRKYHVYLAMRYIMGKLGVDYFPPVHGEAYPWHPNIFDFRFDAEDAAVRFTSAGGGTSRPIGQVTGLGDLYHPRSFRIDNHTYVAILSSYAAYFERLYYASLAQTNRWDVEDADKWGMYPRYDAPAYMRFNITNDEYSAGCYFDFEFGEYGTREVPPVRKLVERRRLRDLRKKLRDDMLAEEVVVRPDAKPVSPDFLYRPGWILDGAMSVDSNHASRVWWSSTAEPPKIEIDDVQNPFRGGFGFFHPFDWTPFPVYEVVGSTRVPRTHWADYCVTLNMARQGTHPPTHPLAELFRHVGYDDEEALRTFVRPYDFTGLGLYGWLTNTYPRCVRQYYDQGAAYHDYTHGCWGDSDSDETLRRLLPNDYTGINQLLGLMDRTIHVPSMRVVSKNVETTVIRHAAYESDTPIRVEFSFDPATETVEVVAGREVVRMSRTRVDADERTARVLHDEIEGLYVSADAPSFIFGGDRELQMHTTDEAFIDEEFLREYGIDGSNSFWIVDVGLTGSRPPFPPFWVDFIPNWTNVAVRGYTTGLVPGHTWDDEILPGSEAWRHYSYQQPTSIVCRVGPTQPGGIHDTWVARESESRYGLLVRNEDSLATVYATGTNHLYKAYEVETYTTHDVLVDKVAGNFDTVSQDMYHLIPELQGDEFGPLPDNIAAYAPFPGAVDATVGYGGVYDAHADYGLSFDPRVWRTFTNDVYRYWFDAYTNHVVRSFDVAVLQTDGYDDYFWLTLTYYPASSLVVTNDIRHTGSEPRASETATTNETSYIEYADAYTIELGPFDRPQETCTVPFVEETNDAYFVRGDRHLIVRDVYNGTMTIMSGTGPDDPGEEYATTPLAEDAVTRYENWSPIPEEIETTTASTSSSSDIPASWAIRHTGGETTNVTGRLYVDFTKDGDSVSGIRAFAKWINPYTGEEVVEERSFPIHIGNVDVWFYFGYSADTDDSPGGPAIGVTEHADGKIITQTDWLWNTIRRIDY